MLVLRLPPELINNIYSYLGKSKEAKLLGKSDNFKIRYNNMERCNLIQQLFNTVCSKEHCIKQIYEVKKSSICSIFKCDNKKCILKSHGFRSNLKKRCFTCKKEINNVINDFKLNENKLICFMLYNYLIWNKLLDK